MVNLSNAQRILLALLLFLGNHQVIVKCNKTITDEITTGTPASTKWTKIPECHLLSGDIGESLGHGVLEVYMLRNDYARTVLPKLSFLRPAWSRIDTALSIRNVTYCGCVVNYTSPLKFPYFGKVDDYDVITLEYNVTDNYLVERRKFEFFLPFFPRRNISDMEHWEVFMYVDMSSAHRAVVFWEPAPSELNITRYQLNVTCEGGPSNVIEYEKIFFFHVPYDLTSSEMLCRFYIRPWLTTFSKWGYRSSSPPIFINRGEVLHFWVIIMCFLFATLAFLACRLYEVISLRWKHKISGSALLIYEAKTEEQLNFVSLLAQTLEEDHHIKIYLDHRDIPLTETKDPLTWFVKTVPNSEYFVFIQLPAPQNTACVPPGVYSSQKMATENIFRMFENSSRIINVELDSCPYEETWVCSNLKNRYKYILPKDLWKLVGKGNPFVSPVGSRLKQSISNCIQEIKSPKEYQQRRSEIPKEACGVEFPLNSLNQNEDKDAEEEDGSETVMSGRRCLLDSFHLDGKESSDSE